MIKKNCLNLNEKYNFIFSFIEKLREFEWYKIKKFFSVKFGQFCKRWKITGISVEGSIFMNLCNIFFKMDIIVNWTIYFKIEEFFNGNNI